LEVFDNVLLIAVDPAGQTDQEELKMVHPGRIGVGLQFGQKFCCGGAYTCVDRRILVSSKRKREFLDSTRGGSSRRLGSCSYVVGNWRSGLDGTQSYAVACTKYPAD
jgi:hypothetical protein